MFKKATLAIMLMLMFIGFASFTFDIQPARASTITVPDDYATIQEAISHAIEGDTIIIRNETYDEELTLTKPLTLVGDNKLNTVIEQLNVSGLMDVYLTNICINRLDARNSSSVWACGCRFPEAFVGSGARLLISQSEVWQVYTYDGGQVLGFYDLPLFGRVVYSLPFGFILLILPIFLVLGVVVILLLVYVRRRQRKQVKD